MRECPLCMAEQTLEQFPHLRNCPHLFCMECLHTYVKIEIQEGRANLKCPQCTELMHPNGKRVFFKKIYYLFWDLFMCIRKYVCLCFKSRPWPLIHHINTMNAVFSNFFSLEKFQTQNSITYTYFLKIFRFILEVRIYLLGIFFSKSKID